MIEWVVDRLHVSESDAHVRAEVERRLRPNLTSAQRRAIVRHALSIHHQNQRLYADVVGARVR